MFWLTWNMHTQRRFLAATTLVVLMVSGCIPTSMDDLPVPNIPIFTLQAEGGTGDGATMPRGNAAGQKTVLLYAGQTRSFAIHFDQPQTRRVQVRYSNDNGGNLTETVQVLVNDQLLGAFDAVDTGAGLAPGNGWNVFVSSEPLGPATFRAGWNTIAVHVLENTGDGYGIELDQAELVSASVEEQTPEDDASDETPGGDELADDAEYVAMPDLVGRSLAQAQTDLQISGLTTGVISYAVTKEVPAGDVISQYPAAGTLVQPGALANLTVSIGWATRQPIHRYDFPIHAGDERYYTTIQSDCGMVGGNAGSLAEQTQGALHLFGGDTYVGFWHSLSGLAIEQQRLLDPNALLPWPINEVHQVRARGVYVRARGAGDWKIELKTIVDGRELILESREISEFGEDAYVELVWPISTGEQLKMLTIVAEAGCDLLVDEIGLYVVVPELTDLREAFLLSAAQVFRCYDRSTGLVRDHSNWPIGDFDSVPGLGLCALTAAAAAELGMVAEQDAREVAASCVDNLLSSPSLGGWLAHFTEGVGPDRSIHPGSGGTGTEYSTIDTALAYIAAIETTELLNMPIEQQSLIAAIEQIDLDIVTNARGEVSMGLDQSGQQLDSTWVHWGGETALVAIFANMVDPCRIIEHDNRPPVYRGRGFIQEIAPLFFEELGGTDSGPDGHGINWYSERMDLMEEQKAVLDLPVFLGGHSAVEIISEGGLHRYHNGGSGGDEPPHTGEDGYGWHWVAPHYAAMVASLDTVGARQQVQTMRDLGLLTPMTGPAESVLLDEAGGIQRRHTKQIVLNAFFSAMGYYHGIVREEGLSDEVWSINSAVNELGEPLARFVAGSVAQQPENLQAEQGTPPPGQSLTTMIRSKAEGHRTVWLHAGESVIVPPFEVACRTTATVTVRYSNDNYGSPETVSVLMAPMGGDWIEVSQFIARDTGNYGYGWNVFVEADDLNPIDLNPCDYQMRIDVLEGTGDGYGIEIDSVTVAFTPL